MKPQKTFSKKFSQFIKDGGHRVLVYLLLLLWLALLIHNVAAKSYASLPLRILVCIGGIVLISVCVFHMWNKETSPTYTTPYDHELYKKFIDRFTSYEEYTEKASNKYIRDVFIKNQTNGITDTLNRSPLSPEEIDSIIPIWLFKHQMIRNWEQYDGKQITIYCFWHPYSTLSMSPFSPYGHRANMIYEYQSTDPKYNSFNGCYHIDSSFVLHCQAKGDILETEVPYEDRTVTFVKLTGTLALDCYENSKDIYLKNCHAKEDSYADYIRRVEKSIRDFNYPPEEYN